MKTTPAAVTDFAGLNALKAKAAGDGRDEETLRAVARQFEALLMQQVLKSARAASFGDDLAGGPGADTYKDLFDQQMAQQMSAGPGLGIAEVLVRQLRGMAPAAPETTALAPPATTTMRVAPAPPLSAAIAPPLPAADPEQFVRAVWPQAEAAARELGLPTEAVVGHAALETGWGRHRPGGDSHNYFGIKADRSWQGGRVASATREVRDGVERSEQAEFRRYASPAESFADYVQFLRGNPRYAGALGHGGDAGRFAEGLQRAGYATDPRYAEKLIGAIDRARAARPL